MKAGTLIKSLDVRFIASFIALFAVFSLIAPRARGMERSQLAQSAISTANPGDWWSPERAPAPHPSLLLALADREHIVLAGPERASSAPNPMPGSAACEESPSGCGYSSRIYSALARGLELPSLSTQAGANFPDRYSGRSGFGAWISDVSLHSEVMLYSLEANYARWQAQLAETSPVMRANGGSVYALGQLNVASASLPVGMYVMPMRGTVGALR